MLGAKQVMGYFNNENGQCKVTIMVADAFDDAMVADSAVRFEVALEAGAKALMDTAAGRSLEFTCGEGAREISGRGQGRGPGLRIAHVITKSTITLKEWLCSLEQARVMPG